MSININKKSGYTILIVDDDSNLNTLIKKTLTRENYNIEISETGKETLEKLNKLDNTLVLLDYKLPDMNASDLIKKFENSKKNPPFIIMTGNEDIEIAVEMMKVGARDYLIKNINFIDFLPTVVNRVVTELINEERLSEAEDTLKKSEKRYRGIVENIPLIIFRFQPKTWLITFINDTYCRYFNIKCEEIIGKSILDFFSKSEHEKMLHNIKSLNIEKPLNTYEILINTPKGKRWQRWIDQAIFDENHQIVEYQSIGEDITERKRTLNELMISESKFRELFNNMSSGVAVYKYQEKEDDFIFSDFNRSAENIEELKKENILGKSIKKVFPGIKDFGIYEIIKKVFRSGSPEYFPVTFYRDERISGWRECYIYKLPTGEIVNVYDDITEKIKAENALIESEKKLRNIMEMVPIGIALTDLEGNFIEINSSAMKIMGLRSKEEAYNYKSVDAYYNPEDRKIFLQQIKEKGLIKNLEIEFKKVDDSKIWVIMNSILTKNNKDEIVFITTFQDITDRKKAEEEARKQELQLIQAEKMASMGVLLSGIAHEINNPNNFILLNSSIVNDLWKEILPILEKYHQENPKFKISGMPFNEVKVDLIDILQGLTDGANRIKNIIENIKEFIKPDKGKWDNYIDINYIIKSAIIITNNIIKKSTNNFTVKYGENLPSIPGNSQQLEQVIINLIINSCQALTDKNQKIIISSKYNSKAKHIIISIKDNGIGIKEENVNKIIDPFYTTKADRGGTGLGLSISYNIIKKFNGELKFNSQKEKGTECSIYLPVTSKIKNKSQH